MSTTETQASAQAIPRSTTNGSCSGSNDSLSHMGAVGSWGASMGCNSQGIPSAMAVAGNSAIRILVDIRSFMGDLFEEFMQGTIIERFGV